MHVFAADGTLMPGYPYPFSLGGYWFSHPVIVDYDLDGECEIIGGSYHSLTALESYYLFAQSAHVEFQPVISDHLNQPSFPVQADDDPTLEFVHVFQSVSIYDPDTDTVTDFPNPPGIQSYIRCVTGDSNGDGIDEIFTIASITGGREVYMMDCATLDVVPGWPIPLPAGNSSNELTLVDVDLNGSLELFLLSGGQAFAWDLPAPTQGGPARVTWGSLRGNAANNSFQYHEAYPARYFLRGDANGDGTVNVSDIVALAKYIGLGPDAFSVGPFDSGTASCNARLDVDANDELNIIDIVALIGTNFFGSFLPPTPYPNCEETDLTGDLTCWLYECP